VKSTCSDGGNMGGLGETQWWNVVYDADVPPNTSLTVHARSGPTATPDMNKGWGNWTTDFALSPADLSTNGVLIPNSPDQQNAYYLQVEFTFKTSDRNATPKLKNFKVGYKCVGIPG